MPGRDAGQQCRVDPPEELVGTQEALEEVGHEGELAAICAQGRRLCRLLVRGQGKRDPLGILDPAWRRQRAPGLMVDGEMQADTAVVPHIIEETYPFSTLKGGANVLVFPNLESGNIAYKLLQRIGGCELIGPLLAGLSKPVHVLQRGSEVNDIVHVAAVAVVDAQEVGKPYRTLATASRVR